MQKRRSNKITVLIVPEENVEPISFRLSKGFVKFLFVVGFVLLVHVVLGAVAYWKYADLLRSNENLLALNAQLKEDNKRVVEVAQDFLELEREYRKVKFLLGVETNEREDREGGLENRQLAVLSDRIVPAIATLARPAVAFNNLAQPVLLTPKQIPLLDHPERIPNLLPIKGFVTKDFEQNGWFARNNHPGIDVVAKRGSVIRAAGAGVIIFANWTFDLGNVVIIDHGGGVVSYYGHTQRMLKPEKAYVKKGEPIALLGSSGKSSGPHLHFEIRKAGVPVDPKEYILAFEQTIRANQAE